MDAHIRCDWVATALVATSGLNARSYKIGFTPEELWVERVIANTNAGEAFAYIASQLQPMIDFNAVVNKTLARETGNTRICFICAPVFGIAASAVTYLWPRL